MSKKNDKPFYKKTWFIIVSVIVVLAIIGALSGEETINEQSNNKNPTTSQKIPLDSIKDVSQNQEQFRLENNTIKIKGILDYSMEIDYYLEDSEGYYVLINQKSCIGVNRNPKVGETYTFEGKLLKNNYNYYRLFCDDSTDTGYYK